MQGCNPLFPVKQNNHNRADKSVRPGYIASRSQELGVVARDGGWNRLGSSSATSTRSAVQGVPPLTPSGNSSRSLTSLPPVVSSVPDQVTSPLVCYIHLIAVVKAVGIQKENLEVEHVPYLHKSPIQERATGTRLQGEDEAVNNADLAAWAAFTGLLARPR